jgi:peptidoglycan/xylan/chitin deacetylase (PgdA/CDA1 family)
MLSSLVKKLLYDTGALGLYHRIRNRRTLTVIMFHRVLDPGDARWASCDPDYTISADLFARTLAFFSRHYHIVSAREVLDARRNGTPLPPRALLVTFDDGWADNVTWALPRLRDASVPGVMFVVADVVGREQPFFQEQLVGALRRGTVGIGSLAQALRAAGVAVEASDTDGMPGLRRVIAALETLDDVRRTDVLRPFRDAMHDGQRHMVTGAELAELEAGGVAIGLHGKTHTPMTRAPDLDAELGGARTAIGARTGSAPTTMSFPHGRYDATIAGRARDAGYELVFTSVPALNPVAPRVGWLLGRLGFETSAITDRSGRFLPERLALLLFRKPRRVLA